MHDSFMPLGGAVLMLNMMLDEVIVGGVGSGLVDNYAAHKHPQVLNWLARHPRFVFHFTPTSASWLNAVEGLFALLVKRRLKRGVFRSVQELKDAIHDFIADTNSNQSPISGTKDPDKIIAGDSHKRQRVWGSMPTRRSTM